MLELAFFIVVTLLVVIVVILSVLIRTVSKATQGIQRIADADTRFRQWSYRIEGTVTNGSMKGFQEDINRSGEAGWEAVAAWTENEIADSPQEAKNFVFVLFKHLSGT